MAIRPKCDVCKIEMDEFGAILLGPPDAVGMVKKYHICIYCYDLIRDRFDLSDLSMDKNDS